MSKTTFPPRARITAPSVTEVREALRVVRKHKVDWWNPWPDEVADNTIRWLRREKLVETFEASGAINMAQNNFGHSWVEDEITERGRAWLRERRA